MTNYVILPELEEKFGKYIKTYYQSAKVKKKGLICMQDIKHEVKKHVEGLNKEIAYFEKVKKGFIEGPTHKTAKIALKLIKREKNSASKLLNCLENT